MSAGAQPGGRSGGAAREAGIIRAAVTTGTPDTGNRMFLTLEGLRGVAAIAVMTFHFHIARPLPSAYLSVDLFFMLSGFVIALRYLDRLRSGEVGAGAFIVARVLRLYPLYLFGTLLGIASLGAGMVFGGGADHRPGELAAQAGFAVLMLPTTIGSGNLYPLNVPAWSLFLEIAANAALAVCAARVSRLVPALLAVTAVLLVAAGITTGTLDLGAEWRALGWGFVRVGFSFGAGVAICMARHRLAGRVPALPPLAIVAVMVATFLLPREGVLASVAAPLVVLLLYPLLIMAAIAVEPVGIAARAARLLGLLSFPIYAVHVPLLAMSRQAARVFGISPLASLLCTLPVIFAVAWAALRWIDEPVRKLLSGWLRGRSARRA